MAIKGLADRISVLGHIKIGGRKKVRVKGGAERPIPVKFDHFVITTNEQDDLGYIVDEALTQKLLADQLKLLVSEHTEPIYNEAGQIIKTVQTVDTEKLKEQNKKLTRILVMLPFDKIDDNLVTSLAVYDKDGCRCRGDGETAEYVDPQTGEVIKVRCPCKLFMSKLNPEDDIDLRPSHEKHLKPEPGKGLVCKANGNLRVMIHRARTLGGIHVFRTTSLNSIAQLQSAMHQVSNLTGGIMAGIPLVLELQPKRVIPGPNKKPQLAYVVALTYRASINEFLREVLQEAALRESLRKQIKAGEILALPPPGKENKYEQVAISQEFYEPAPADAEGVVTGDGEYVMDAEYTEHAQSIPSPGSSRDHEEELPPPPDDPNEALDPLDYPGVTPTEKLSSGEPAPEPPPPAEPEPPPESPKEPEQPAEPPPPEKPQEPAEQAEPAKTEKPETTVVEFENFPPIDTKCLEGADTSPANKDIRKAFFEKARKAGFADESIRGWLEKLWRIQSSSKLETWQVVLMTKVLPG